MSIRIVVVDDHELARLGTASVFNDTDIDVVGMACNGQQALELVSNLQPDIVLMDISMPIMDGFEATERLKQAYPLIRVLVLTIMESEATIKRVMSCGAEGYVSKSVDAAILIETVKAVHRGVFTFPPLKGGAVAESKADKGLTARQLEVARLWAEGWEVKLIARRLDAEPRTIEKHIADSYQRTGTHNKIEMREYLEQHGLV